MRKIIFILVFLIFMVVESSFSYKLKGAGDFIFVNGTYYNKKYISYIQADRDLLTVYIIIETMGKTPETHEHVFKDEKNLKMFIKELADYL